MYFGLGQLPRFWFVGWSAIAAIVGSLVAMAVFGLGRHGKRTASRFLRTTLYATGAITLGLWVWAAISGELTECVAAVGAGPLFELALLLAVTLFPFVFMAVRFVDGLPDVPRESASEHGGDA